jgi:O-antigen ligase
MRIYALWLVVLALSVYAWKDWYKSLCGLIVLMAVLEHKDMPRTIFDVPGLNPWNLVFFIVLLAWMSQRNRERLRWDIPRGPAVLLLMGFGVLLFGFARLVSDRQNLLDELTVAELVSDYLFNPVKWVVVGLLLFDGSRSRRRLILGLASILALYFLISLQAIRWIVPSGALYGGELSSYTIRTLQREIGYHRNDVSTMLAGGSWALLAMLPLVVSRYRAALVLLSLVVVFAQLLTGGRGGYLAWCAVGLVLGFVRWRRYLILAPLIVILFITLVPSAADRALQGITENPTTGSEEVNLEELTAGRNLLWPRVIDTIWDAPLIGYGRAAMQRTGLSAWYAASQGGDEDLYIAHPHNAYLEILLDSGVIGLTVALALYGYFAAIALSLIRDRRSPAFLAVGGIALSLILAQLVGSFTGQSLYPRETTVGMWCAIGLLLRVWVQRSSVLVTSSYRKRNRGLVDSADTNIRPSPTANAAASRSIQESTLWWRPGAKSSP